MPTARSVVWTPSWKQCSPSCRSPTAGEKAPAPGTGDEPSARHAEPVGCRSLNEAIRTNHGLTLRPPRVTVKFDLSFRVVKEVACGGCVLWCSAYNPARVAGPINSGSGRFGAALGMEVLAGPAPSAGGLRGFFRPAALDKLLARFSCWTHRPNRGWESAPTVGLVDPLPACHLESVVTESQPAAPVGFADKHHFLIRRLHSLTGLIPIGVFLCFHLLANASILVPGSNGAQFQRSVNQIHALGPLVVPAEIVGIFLPLLFHSLLGEGGD